MSASVATRVEPKQATDGVRCQNAKCRAKIAEKLDGTLIVKCRKCGQLQTIYQQAA